MIINTIKCDLCYGVIRSEDEVNSFNLNVNNKSKKFDFDDNICFEHLCDNCFKEIRSAIMPILKKKNEHFNAKY